MHTTHPPAAVVRGAKLGASSLNLFTQQDEPGPDGSATDGIGNSEMHLSSDFWAARTHDPDSILLDSQEIAEFNASLFATDKYMVDLEQFPQQLSGDEVRSRILAISKPFDYDLYDDNGDVLEPEDFEELRAELDLNNIPDTCQVRFALVVQRADMRRCATDDRFFSTPDSKNLDRFQENGLFPGDALAVLHESKDGEWYFVQSYNYAAWVRKESLAIGDRQTVHEYENAPEFLVITGDKVSTSSNPELPELSELQLDMGVRVPLAERAENENVIHGQATYTSYTVRLPVRKEDGSLQIRRALIARNKDVHIGYLPYSRRNILQQAFKFLGERYGWGHSNNARDCTGFVADVYKTFGILMPRNSAQQGKSTSGENTRFTTSTSLDDKHQELESLDVGDLIYVPGHVLMFIGNVDGQPFVIHDVSEFSYTDEKGEYYEGILNGVSVTPLIPLHASQEATYVEAMYNIKKIR